jgi:glucosamine--fructose-6-phosphate aminotransferase (isomerizing)
VVAVAPGSASTLREVAARMLPVAEGIPEMLSPVLLAIPGELFAAYRAEVLGESYFRRAGGGRMPGGSRVRTSAMWDAMER